MDKQTNSTGNYSTGDYSTGDYSTGNRSTGHFSTGNRSTGYRSTGHWSISDYSTGYFSTEDYSGFGVFDRPCTLETWANWEKPDWLFFDLTEWIKTSDMTEQEKKDNPKHVTTGGYLKVYDYKTAFQNSYNKATRQEQLKIKDCPNFDAEKFYLISGIDVDSDLSNDKNNTDTEKPLKTITIDGQEYELKKIIK